MRPILAAIASGTDPLAPLPPAAFHRTLEDTIHCPKCHMTYILIANYDWAVSRYFAPEAQRHFALLKQAIFLEHNADHPTTHFETNGVSVTRHAKPAPPAVAPLSPHVM